MMSCRLSTQSWGSGNTRLVETGDRNRVRSRSMTKERNNHFHVVRSLPHMNRSQLATNCVTVLDNGHGVGLIASDVG
jgi:hypothetical protein